MPLVVFLLEKFAADFGLIYGNVSVAGYWTVASFGCLVGYLFCSWLWFVFCYFEFFFCCCRDWNPSRFCFKFNVYFIILLFLLSISNLSVHSNRLASSNCSPNCGYAQRSNMSKRCFPKANILILIRYHFSSFSFSSFGNIFRILFILILYIRDLPFLLNLIRNLLVIFDWFVQSDRVGIGFLVSVWHLVCSDILIVFLVLVELGSCVGFFGFELFEVKDLILQFLHILAYETGLTV